MNILLTLFLLLALNAYSPFIESVSIQVEASADDGREVSNTANNIVATSAPILDYPTTTGRWGGARFLNVAIPRSAQIISATVVATDTTGGRVIDVTIFAQAADNPATFNTTAADLSGRARSTASVEWDVASTANGEETSPSIVSVIQETVDRSGYVSGNAIAIILQLNANNTSFSRSFDGNPTKAFKLNVTFRRKIISLF